ncbi:hypothetical protein NE237_021683 [Protea cynaroides]|uniref:Uncharacterized protein n=1 Tax=Protea cynaroides TaxID=273540 RepID=A0A9Q0K537_9MAGN|nr:hypothetical protein NE237_021683 [Protea cynaroides]
MKMERFSIPIYGSLKKYWKRRTYRRLGDVGYSSVRKNRKVLRLGGNSSRRSWKIRAIPKLQLKINFPMKIWKKFRDGYINMMLGFAGKAGGHSESSVFGGKRIPRGRPIPQLSEFDKRLVLQIYNSLVASRELVSY